METQELLKNIVDALVTHTGADVQYRETDSAIIFSIAVDPTDRGRIIGGAGRTIKALQVITQAMVRRKSRKKVCLALVDDDGEPL